MGAAASLRLSGQSEMKGSDGVTLSTWIKTTRPSVNVSNEMCEARNR